MGGGGGGGWSRFYVRGLMMGFPLIAAGGGFEDGPVGGGQGRWELVGASVWGVGARHPGKGAVLGWHCRGGDGVACCAGWASGYLTGSIG